MNKYTAYIPDVVQAVPVKAAMELYGINVTSKGFAECPFHNEKTPSFKAYQTSFYCFGCGASGDVISLVQKLFNCSFTEAIKKLNSDFALNLPIEERLTLRQADAYRKRQREIEEARQRERKRKSELHNSYNNLLDEYNRLEQNFKKYRPKQYEETLHPLFVEACKMLGYISYLIDSFDWEGGSAA